MRRATSLTREASLSGPRNDFMNLRNTDLHCFGKCTKNSFVWKCYHLWWHSDCQLAGYVI